MLTTHFENSTFDVIRVGRVGSEICRVGLGRVNKNGLVVTTLVPHSEKQFSGYFLVSLSVAALQSKTMQATQKF